MLTTLDAVVERLIAGYDPDRIILFGSRASGDADEDSDIDLLVVKETDRRPLERGIEVERLLADRRVSLDVLVYTPREMLDLYAAGSPLIEAVVESGRVLYMRKATAAWFADAQEEVESASILLGHQKYRGVCRHSQQGVEKGLKALLLEAGRRPPRTHDLVELLNLVVPGGTQIELPLDDAIFLNSVYRGRYPTEEGLLPYGEPTEADARKALSIAESMIRHVKDALGTLGNQ
jgi:HEPN domain-containing protein/predicted nucleotidyltransferase